MKKKRFFIRSKTMPFEKIEGESIHHLSAVGATLTVLLVLFGVITFWVKNNGSNSIDMTVQTLFFQSPLIRLYPLWWLLSFMGNTYTFVTIMPIIAILLHVFRHTKYSRIFLLGVLAEIPLYTMKIIIDRTRPSDYLLVTNEIIKSNSFPSGHVVNFVIFWGLLYFWSSHLKSIWVRLILMFLSLFSIVAIGFARIGTGEHFFTDVVGGYLMGFILLLLIVKIFHFHYGRN